MQLMLGLDVGTSSICALALDVESLESMAIRSVPNDSTLTGLPKGYHEQDPKTILSYCIHVLKELLDDETICREDVVGIGITGQMHGLLIVNESIDPITNLITWRDQRIETEIGNGFFHERLMSKRADLAKRAGCRLHPGYGGIILNWLASNECLPAGSLALSAADFVAAFLTGITATEPTHAASWGLYDIEEQAWLDEYISVLNFPKATLPPVRETANELGTMLSVHAEKLGLSSNVVICSPLGDNQASFIGSTGLENDIVALNLGTGGQVSIPTTDLSSVKGFESRPLPFGRYLMVGASLCGGSSYDYLRRFYQMVVREIVGIEIGDAELFGKLNSLAEDAQTGASGISADTRFGGTRDNTCIRGSITGIDNNNLTPQNLSRAFLEGMVLELANMARKVSIKHAKSVVASGNAVRRNPLLIKIIEDAFGLPCKISQIQEEAAFGAAYAAAIQTGQVSGKLILGEQN